MPKGTVPRERVAFHQRSQLLVMPKQILARRASIKDASSRHPEIMRTVVLHTFFVFFLA